jgi:hypothetical protein
MAENIGLYKVIGSASERGTKQLNKHIEEHKG